MLSREKRRRGSRMASNKKEYEDLEDILNEMESEGEWGDVTTGLRRAYAARIRRALARHDTKMMMDCMKAAFQAMGPAKEGEKENKS